MDLLPLNCKSDAALVSLKSELTDEDALGEFTRRDAAWMRRVRHVRLRSIAHVFVPYYMFHVNVADGRRANTGLFALDAVRGTLDPYRFEGSVANLTLERIHSRNALPAALDIETAWSILVDKLRRIVFQTGFLRIRAPRFHMERAPLTVYVPYWVGFYADDPAVQVDVLDGVRGTFEGAKARALFENWLTDSRSPVQHPADRPSVRSSSRD